IPGSGDLLRRIRIVPHQPYAVLRQMRAFEQPTEISGRAAGVKKVLLAGFAGAVLLVILDRDHDADAGVLAQRNVPSPAPVAERGDERHRCVLQDVLERAHDAPGADVARAGEIAPQGDEAEIAIELSDAELLGDERGLSARVDQEAAAKAAMLLGSGVEK